MPDKGSTGFADDICRVRTYLAGKTRPGPLRTRHGAILPPLALRSHPAGDRDTAPPWSAPGSAQYSCGYLSILTVPSGHIDIYSLA